MKKSFLYVLLCAVAQWVWSQRGQGGGQVITVRQGATLNLSNGTLFIKKDGKTYNAQGAVIKE